MKYYVQSIIEMNMKLQKYGLKDEFSLTYLKIFDISFLGYLNISIYILPSHSSQFYKMTQKENWYVDISSYSIFPVLIFFSSCTSLLSKIQWLSIFRKNIFLVLYRKIVKIDHFNILLLILPFLLSTFSKNARI